MESRTTPLSPSYLLLPDEPFSELVLVFELFPDLADSLLALPSLDLVVPCSLVFILSALGCVFGFSLLLTWVGLLAFSPDCMDCLSVSVLRISFLSIRVSLPTVPLSLGFVIRTDFGERRIPTDSVCLTVLLVLESTDVEAGFRRSSVPLCLTG